MKPLVTVALLILVICYAFAPAPSLSVGAPPDSSIESIVPLVPVQVQPVTFAPRCENGVCSIEGSESHGGYQRGQPVRNVARFGGRVLNALRPKNWFCGRCGC